MARFDASMEAMVDMYIFETSSLLEQLDEILMKTERENSIGEEYINEIFRIMHTIKGSSAMMGLENIATLTHAIEDMFFILRENPNTGVDISHLYDIVFSASDFLKAEIEIIQTDIEPTDFSDLKQKIRDYIEVLKNGGVSKPTITPATEKAVDNAELAVEENSVESVKEITSVKVFFDDGCQMENLRALILLNSIKEYCSFIESFPADIETNPNSAKLIIDDGFIIRFKPIGKAENIYKIIEEALNVNTYEVIDDNILSKPKKIEEVKTTQEQTQNITAPKKVEPTNTNSTVNIEKVNTVVNQASKAGKQSLISVNLNKLDQLLDMVGEIVITEAMVTSNPDLKGLKMDNFQKASRQLRKLTDELQDIVMSIRMVPLSGVFNKMSRIVRDMKIKLDKDVELIFDGEETEVDKSVIDSLNDPLMHLVRNAMDHGVETTEERLAAGKTSVSQITLSAFNSSGEVVIIVSDNGKGINPEKVLAKASANGILTKPENEYTDKEIFNLIMAPGFSMKEQVTEFSGRGVGTDVVRKNIEKIGGTVTVDSKFGEGTSFIIKIPLTLAIVEGMQISVGESTFTIPISSIKESFKLKSSQLIHDTDGSEMIMIRGECYPLIRLHEIYTITPTSTDLFKGIVVVVESEGKSVGLFADELIGEQQIVVKPFSPLLNKYGIKKKGMAGCSILGDGSITIILDVNNLINEF